MQLFYKNWYNQFLSELSRTKKLRIISPFVSEQIIRNIESLYDFSNLELVTRYNLKDFAGGLSSLSAVTFAVEMGARVFGVKDLHSKVYIFDQRAAIISSANLSRGGLITNYECGILITDSNVIAELHFYFDQLSSTNVQPLTSELCENWAHQIEGIEIPNSPISALPDYGSTVFTIRTDIRYFIKFLGTSSHRVQLSFETRDELEEGECHYACGFAGNKKPRQVNTGDIVYLARMTHSPNDFAIFGKAEAIRFVDGRDVATDNERERLPWKKQWPIYLRVINPVFIDGTMGDCILLYDLISTLDYQSFPSTLARYKNGERNINPKKSLAQRGIIPITQEAAEWLNPRFDECLSRIGQVPDAFLETLPQSELDHYSLIPS